MNHESPKGRKRERGRRMHILTRSAVPLLLVPLAAMVCGLSGCGDSKTPAADPQPFQAAIAQYLEQNNMAMAVKAIREGPFVEGKTAQLTASLTHATLGGPAVTWQFRFTQNPDGTWKAVSHK